MPVTKDQAQMLTALAIACRPVGAPRWDEAGIMAALAKVARINLADVMAAVARAASDRTAETPAVIAATGSLHWNEKVAERTTVVAPKREDQCLDCGRHLDACLCRPEEPVEPMATEDARKFARAESAKPMRTTAVSPS